MLDLNGLKWAIRERNKIAKWNAQKEVVPGVDFKSILNKINRSLSFCPTVEVETEAFLRNRNWYYSLASLVIIHCCHAQPMLQLSDCPKIEAIFWNSLFRRNLSGICCYSIILFFPLYLSRHSPISNCCHYVYGEVSYWFKFINTTSHWFILCLFIGFCNRIACTQFLELRYIMQLKMFQVLCISPKVGNLLFSKLTFESRLNEILSPNPRRVLFFCLFITNVGHLNNRELILVFSSFLLNIWQLE